MYSKCPDETLHVQDDVNPHFLHIIEGTFSLDTTPICNGTSMHHLNEPKRQKTYLLTWVPGEDSDQTAH